MPPWPNCVSLNHLLQLIRRRTCIPGCCRAAERFITAELDRVSHSFGNQHPLVWINPHSLYLLIFPISSFWKIAKGKFRLSLKSSFEAR